MYFITNNIWELSGMPLITHMGNSRIGSQRLAKAGKQTDEPLAGSFPVACFGIFPPNSNSFIDVIIYVILIILYVYIHMFYYIYILTNSYC